MGWPADIPASAHLFLDPSAGDPFVDTLDVDGEDGHHLARVLRLRSGETVTVADGVGGWRPYEVATITAGGTVRLDATGAADHEPVMTPRLAVAFALTKGDKPELVVQKLTELGIDRILPVMSDRSISRPDPARAASVLERWHRIAREAARQCRRATLPAVEPLTPLGKLAGHSGLVVTERGGGPAGELGSPPGGELLAVVGPEGGLTAEEVEALRPWGRLGLGPHILRAETAALAAATALTLERRPSSAPPGRVGCD